MRKSRSFHHDKPEHKGRFSHNNKFQRSFHHKPFIRTFTKEEKEKISLLDKEVKSINNKISNSEKILKNTESDFRDKKQEKEITIYTKNGNEIKGTLIDIDKYRIHIKIGERIKFYYKHSLVGYLA